ncbi:MAG: AAA family ATPase, partial [Halanaeroarchaeum sp.]
QRTMMQLLSEMDGFDERGEVRIMAATNRFDMLDRAILRPGRFDRLIEVPDPDVSAREEILRIHTADMTLAEEIDFERLARRTESFNGAQLRSLATEAGMYAIRDDRAAVRMSDFAAAREKLEAEADAGTPGYTTYIQ